MIVAADESHVDTVPVAAGLRPAVELGVPPGGIPPECSDALLLANTA